MDRPHRPYRSEDHYSAKNSNNRNGNNRHRQYERSYNDRDDQRNHLRDTGEQPPSSNLDEFGREIRDARGDVSGPSKMPDTRHDMKSDRSPNHRSSRDFPPDPPERELKDDHHHNKDRHHRNRDHRREEQGSDHFQRPPRDPVSYRNANPPSCFLLLSGIPISVTEDFVSDSLKPFGPLIDIRRLFSSHGNPTQQLVVEYDSVSSSRDVLQTIQSLPNAFTIQSYKPSIQFYHPAKKTNKKERRDETPDDEGPKIKLNVLGLPLDFQSRFELEGVICHILGSTHPQHIIKSITFENDSNTSSTIGTIMFTDLMHVTELLRRTGGQVVIRGFPLTLLPLNIPELSQYPTMTDSRIEVPFVSEIAPPPPEIVYKEPIRLPPHYSAPPDHYYVYSPESGTILDVTSGLHFDLAMACFVDTNRHPIPFDDPRVFMSLPLETEVPTNANVDLESEPNLPQPVRTGPIEFSLKTQPPPSSKPKSALANAAKSKLASASTLTSNSATVDPAAPVAPTRGGRHFINVPRADRPARAELPPPTPQDPPFTRANVCLICRALFNSLEHIKRHVEQSPQHASKLKEFLRQSVTNLEQGDESEGSTRPNPKKRLRDEIEPEDRANSPDAQMPNYEVENNEPKLKKLTEMETDSVEQERTFDQDPPSQVSYQGSNIGMKMMQKIGYAGGKLGRKG